MFPAGHALQLRADVNSRLQPPFSFPL